MKCCLALLMALSCLHANATRALPDTTIALDLQMRVRSEWRDGYKLANDGESAVLLAPIQRSRMGISGNLSPLQFKLQFQSIRNFFGRPSGEDQGYPGDLSVSEAWVSVPLRNNIQLKVGRQHVAFDNERIVGAVDWSHPGRFLDGIQLKWKHQHGVTSAVYSRDEVTNTQRWMVHHLRTWNQHKLTVLLFDQQSQTEPQAFTAGGTWSVSTSNQMTLGAEAYAQFDPTGSAGYMLVAEVQKTRPQGEVWTCGLDLLSGGKGAFQPFLGTNHKFYGWMDHFYVGTSTDGLANLRLERKTPIFEQKAALGATFHHFRGENGSELLAHEIDVWLTGKSQHGIQWHVGWSIMDPTETHVSRQGSLSQNEWPNAANHLQQWGWISLNFQPSILLK